MESLDVKKFVIIGGTTKSGTSSLFNYLASHPDIQGSSMKETRFFLDEDYPIKSKYRYPDGLERYQEFFQPSEKHLFMEASPDYLYSRNTPSLIHQLLPDTRLVFILRNPVERFISWYKFCKQNGTIAKGTSLFEYFEMQKTPEDRYSDQHLMALVQGKYSSYLKRYLEVFGNEKVFICYLEDLKFEPVEFMKNLCAFLNIDSSIYLNFHFEIHNPTNTLKNQNLHGFYLKASFAIRKKTHNKKAIHGLLKAIKRRVFPIYLMLNGAAKVRKDEPNDTEFLLEYYMDEFALYESRYEHLLKNYDTIGV